MSCDADTAAVRKIADLLWSQYELHLENKGFVPFDGVDYETLVQILEKQQPLSSRKMQIIAKELLGLDIEFGDQVKQECFAEYAIKPYPYRFDPGDIYHPPSANPNWSQYPPRIGRKKAVARRKKLKKHQRRHGKR